MPIATGIAAVATAIGAVLTGLAQVLTVLRAPGKQAAAPVPVGGTPPAVPAAPTGELAHVGRATRLAAWSLGLGLSAWLLAVGAVALVGVTTAPLDSAPLRTLEWGSITLAALAVAAGALSLHQSAASGRGPARPLLAAAGLAVSLGALAALLIAGS